MSILVTGGTGKTGTPLVRKLQEAGYTTLVASRSGKAPEGTKGIKFDWYDPSTFETPFAVDPSINKVYLVPPLVLGSINMVKPFVDLAISKGVRRFVFLSGAGFEKGSPMHGEVHEYLSKLDNIEFCVIRPTWFCENMILYARSIRERDEFLTNTEDGKMTFAAVEDVADAAFEALTTEKIAREELFIIGPELLTHDEVAELLSNALGRKISHKKATPEERTKFLLGVGLDEELVKKLVEFEHRAAGGHDERLAQVENKYVGKRRYGDWLGENKAAWVKV